MKKSTARSILFILSNISVRSAYNKKPPLTKKERGAFYALGSTEQNRQGSE